MVLTVTVRTIPYPSRCIHLAKSSGLGNPIGGLVFSSAFTGQLAQLHEWTVRPFFPIAVALFRLDHPTWVHDNRISWVPNYSVFAGVVMVRMRLGYASISTMSWDAIGTCQETITPVSINA
jgi:hypothetical protein